MKIKTLVFLALSVCAVFILSGCAPTYPKGSFKDSIIKVCKREYKLDVKVGLIGKTAAVYLPLSDLIDFTFAITTSASEKINDVILTSSRVALSSDADYDFFVVIAHDTRIPEIQLVIVKSVLDVKRFLLNDISRGEYAKRMLIDIRLSPQAQKERSIKEVFEKMGLDKKWQEQVMNDFFRSEPAALGDIGYWSGRFYVKDIPLPEFLAEQIASRVKIEAREDKKYAEQFTIKTSKGTFVTKGGKRTFVFETLSDPKWFKDLETNEISTRVTELVFKVASHVLRGYRFSDFDDVEVIDQLNGSSVRVVRDDLERFRAKKAKLEDIIRR